MPDIAVEDASLPDSSTVQEEDLTHDFPGGPTDPSILRSFNSHVAAAVWHGEFVERWQPETNTFHMTVGEMTLTLDDLGTILGLSIVGKSISVPDVTNHHGVTLLVYGLGITKRVAHEEVSTSDSDPKETIQCAARGYLLFLFGCTLFSDKSDGRVPVVYLGLLMDLGSIHTYAWGAAALAFLYRQLGYASRSGVKQMGGYMTLLEA
ncbi:protein MAIN-LIKE 1-like [Camellia sinensis]|uniref:protein MAIN-LIKE 1-like n=1 Tax=Camellia sinensis TaxID=4442 RepID=UPI00103596AA|nr:protein MAIN-LIKE 1-like [Camellia sinensis]